MSDFLRAEVKKNKHLFAFVIVYECDLYLFSGAQTEPEGFQSKRTRWYLASGRSVNVKETTYISATQQEKHFKRDGEE